MRRLLPPPQTAAVDLDEAYEYPAGKPWLRANMVSSLDGAASAAGLSGGLSGAADKRVFGVLRGLADCVLVGASTVRAEGYRAASPKPAYAQRRAELGQRPAPPLAVVTRSLDLDLDGPLFTGAAVDTIVVTCGAADPERVALARTVGEVVVAGGADVDLPAAIGALHERGLTRLLCEGGPTLLGQVAAAGLLDELCLTTSPLLVGGTARRIMAGPELAHAMRIAMLLEDEGVLFTRYVRTGRAD